MRKQIVAVVKNLMLERPARAAGRAKLKANLERSQVEINSRLEALAVNAATETKHHTTLRHIIAIERWGQARLRVLLGEPFKDDNNHAYKPPESSSWESLRAAFNATRTETLGLADTLPDDKLGSRVFHNDLGEMTALGWLRYLSIHAATEAKRIT